jgi:hypothetical protein
LSRKRGTGGTVQPERRWPVAAIVVGGAIAAVIAIFLVVILLDMRQQEARTPPGEVQSYDVGQAGRHSTEDVDYEQSPPVGGVHDPRWQNCGFYDEPIRDENAVHSLEHGAVWITYSPNLPQNQVERIRELSDSNSYVLASPYPDQQSPVVATAWGKQLTLESPNDPALEKFIGAYQQGPQTPEVGAVCTGGLGEPG